MGLPFLSNEDSRSRLSGTICTYKGKPVYVAQSPGKDAVDIAPMRANISRDDYQSIKISDPDFSYKSVSLGYLSYQGRAYYVMRIPYRQTKAGLSIDCIATEPYLDVHNFFTSQAFERCILGKHDDLDTALKKIAIGKSSSVPIHRHVALSNEVDRRTIQLLYRVRVVGTYDKEHKRFNINDGPDYSFIHRILTNLGIPGV